MFPPLLRLFAAGLVACAGMPVHAATTPAQTRGEMLYSTHCIACHTEQVHWRDKRLATDWNSLEHQVDRWQTASRLNWEKEDIVAVTRYLNSLYYHFPTGKDDTVVSHPQAR